MGESTVAPRKEKPEKPSPDYPLFPHQNSQWAKKVRGRLYDFGLWYDPVAALDLWVNQKDDLLAGRTPCPQGRPAAEGGEDDWEGPIVLYTPPPYPTTEAGGLDRSQGASDLRRQPCPHFAE